jgi:molybdenum-dependent DNA-binding transcriptional regulator ModE
VDEHPSGGRVATNVATAPYAFGDSRIAYFLAVCRFQSFSAAAKACGVSQPSVTAGVHRLERAVGGMLLERGTPVCLTALGQDLYPLFEEIDAVTARVAVQIVERCGALAGMTNSRASQGDGSERPEQQDLREKKDSTDKPE